jgi:hypothetical protein
MQSLQNSQTPASFIDTIRLSLRHPIGHKKYWILVEGETDQKLYQKLIDGDKTQVKAVSPSGIANLRSILKTLLAESTESLQPIKHVLGIRDADFLHLDGQQESQANLFITDFHDAEMMMIACDETFKSWVSEYLSEELDNFQQLRQQFLHALIFLSGLRWLNHREDLTLNFNKFYDESCSNSNRQECIDKLVKRSPNRKREVSVEEIDKLVAEVTDYYNLCNGHDMEEVMADFVPKTRNKGITSERVGESLRLAYHKHNFATTQLYQSLIK